MGTELDLPFLSFRTRKAWLVWWKLLSCLSVVLLLTACAKTSTMQRDVQDLQLHAEQLLYQHAKEAFYKADYEQAALLYQRFLANHPVSMLRDEARWGLARSYQLLGKSSLALQEYRILARPTHKGPYQREAELRVVELMRAGSDSRPKAESVQAMLLPASAVQDAQNRQVIVNRLETRPNTTWVVDIPCGYTTETTVQSLTPSPSTYQRELIHAGLRNLAEVSRQSGGRVYLAVHLQCLGEFHPQREWKDWLYDPVTRSTRPSAYDDLLQPNYQDYIVDLLLSFSDSGIDGILFKGTLPLGPGNGLSSWAIQAFEQVFPVRLSTQELFRLSDAGALRRFQQGLYEPDVDREAYSPLFWRWTGWKAREICQAMLKVKSRLKDKFPYLQVGVELHVESINEPIVGLFRYGQDWIQAQKGGFDFFFVDPRPVPRDMREGATMQTASALTGEDWNRLLRELIQTIGDQAKLWVHVTGESEERGTIRGCCARVPESAAGELPPLVGRVYDFAFVP